MKISPVVPSFHDIVLRPSKTVGDIPLAEVLFNNSRFVDFHVIKTTVFYALRRNWRVGIQSTDLKYNYIWLFDFLT